VRALPVLVVAIAAVLTACGSGEANPNSLTPTARPGKVFNDLLQPEFDLAVQADEALTREQEALAAELEQSPGPLLTASDEAFDRVIDAANTFQLRYNNLLAKLAVITPIEECLGMQILLVRTANLSVEYGLAVRTATETLREIGETDVEASQRRANALAELEAVGEDIAVAAASCS
jgi:hypothetical protein